MPQDAALATALPKPIPGWQPTTFLDRGVVVPFTTPLLACARLRPAERGGLELLVPAVCGPGSVGILPWEKVGSLCSPTLFDRRLGARLARIQPLTPAAVRQATCAEAAAGLAGPEVQEAALAAQEADAAEQQRAQEELLGSRREATGHRPAGPPAAAPVPVPVELARLLGPVGLGAQADAARLPRTLAAVIALVGQMPDGQRPGAAEAAVVTTAAERLATAATTALATARAAAADLPLLLRRWAGAPVAVADELGRAEWLLDGWAWLCRLATCPEKRISRSATLAELAALAPPLPREAAGGATPPRPEMPAAVLNLLRGVDWRSGVTAQDLVARNERLLAGSLVVAG